MAAPVSEQVGLAGSLPCVLLFPGQGVQRRGMGEPWREAASWELVGPLSEASGHDVAELLLRVDDVTLRRADLAQMAVFSLCMLALHEFRLAARPAIVAACGHSLGEYSALVAAGALGLTDGAGLVAARGAAMRDAAGRHPGTMAVLIGADEDGARELCAGAGSDGEQAWVANVNAPGQVVVSGPREGVAAVRARAERQGVKAVDIAVSGAFHSPLMASAVPRLREALTKASFADRHLPVVANVDARPHGQGRVWPDLAARQLISPVRWEQSMRVVVARWHCLLVEVGPGRTLTGMLRRINPATEVAPVNAPRDAASLADRCASDAAGATRALGTKEEKKRCPTG